MLRNGTPILLGSFYFFSNEHIIFHSKCTILLTYSHQQHQRRQWHPTPALLPGKSHGRRSLVGCSPWGREESDTTERLPFHFSLSCTEEGNGNPLQCSCLENPRDGEPGGLHSMGSHRVGHDGSDSAAAAAHTGSNSSTSSSTVLKIQIKPNPLSQFRDSPLWPCQMKAWFSHLKNRDAGQHASFYWKLQQGPGKRHGRNLGKKHRVQLTVKAFRHSGKGFRLGAF